MPLVLALLLAAAPTPLEQAWRIQPIGWSADGQRVALRVFFGSEHGEVPQCEGYVDAEGKTFNTGLALVVLKGEAVEWTSVIQKSPTDEACTPPKEAKAALESAKARLDALGIDRTTPGRVLMVKSERTEGATREVEGVTKASWQETWRAVDGERVRFEVKLKLASTEEGGVGDVTLRGGWTSRLSDPPKTGALKLAPVTYSLNMAGGYRLSLLVLESPDGQRLVPFVMRNHFNMRGSWGGATLLSLKP